MQDIRMSNFQMIPPVIKNLIIINALMFFAQTIFQSNGMINMSDLFALHDPRSYYFKLHQVITHMFMHGDFMHLLFNMFALWMFGSMLENFWGPKRFLTFYFVCGIGAAVLHLGVLYMDLTPEFEKLANYPPSRWQSAFEDRRLVINSTTVGASGAVFGCLAAFGYLFPNSTLYIYFLFPVKAKYLVIFLAAAELWLGVKNSAGDNVAHWAHLGGALVGFLLVLYWNKTNRRRFY